VSGLLCLLYINKETELPDKQFRIFIVYFAVNVILFSMMFVHSFYKRGTAWAGLNEKKEVVKTLGLTDLCLFTEARYTRHPSMADLNSAFQDYPVSFEHFPSGSLIMPPRHLVLYGMD